MDKVRQRLVKEKNPTLLSIERAAVLLAELLRLISDKCRRRLSWFDRIDRGRSHRPYWKLSSEFYRYEAISRSALCVNMDDNNIHKRDVKFNSVSCMLTTLRKCVMTF